MEDLDKILDKLEELLRKEKEVILSSMRDQNAAEELLKITEEKEDLLSRLSLFTREQALERREKIEKVDYMLQMNRELILQNIKFIEDIFEAIFETTKTYSPSGCTKPSPEGLINKKV